MFGFISKLRTQANRSKLKDKNFEFLFQEDRSGEYIVFDTETTGLDPKKDEILSIGAVKIKDNKILKSQTFEVFLQNSKEISSKSIKIHGIRPFDLKDAKTTK
ncbi:MAG TPA: DNA polymerase III subunit epsilon, partial [Sulfurimonas sp. UBA12504]